MPERTLSHRNAFALVCWLFLASGFSSLIYQVVWTRQLVLVFGSTTFATATVLAVFMGGLALGSLVAGRLTDEIKRPLIVYGVLEGLIGLWALAVPFLFDLALPAYRIIWEIFRLDFLSFSLLRFALAFLVLILPTTAMGATLPLLAKFVTERLDIVGKRVGTIYAVNTLGAVLGASVTGFILLPEMGLTATTWLAAGINFLLFAIVAAAGRVLEKVIKCPEYVAAAPAAPRGLDAEALRGLDAAVPPGIDAAVPERLADEPGRGKSKRRKTKSKALKHKAGQKADESARSAHESERAADHSKDAGQPTRDGQPHPAFESPLLDTLCLSAMAVSGAAAMTYEIAWTRLLSMVIGSSTYAFTIMLATFLVGIFAGSYIASRFVDRLKTPVVWFGLFQMLVCLGCLVSVYLFQFLPWWNLVLSNRFPHDPVAALFVRFVLASVVMWPLTLSLGMIFPIAVKCVSFDLEKLGRSVGTVYSANTAGAIIGSILSGFVLIPRLGVEPSLVIASGANLVMALLLAFSEPATRPRLKLAFALSGLTVVLLCHWVVSTWDRKLLILAQAQRRALRDNEPNFKTLGEWRRNVEGQKIAYWQDGICSNVAVILFPNSVNKLSLLTNGCVDASDAHDMNQQILLAILPMMLKPQTHSACVIGWGSGITVGELSRFPLESITAIEIEPKVVEASQFFHHLNYVPERNPKVKLEVNDGRNFLLATSNKFDLIVSEPSNPWQVGVCNLYTREYFTYCKDRLNPGGAFALWLQVNEIPPESVRSVLSALHATFPNCLAMASDPFNLVVVASEDPLTLHWETVEAAFKNPKLKRTFERVDLPTAAAVLARIMATPNGISSMVKDVPPNTDDRNTLEFAIGETYETKTFALANAALLGSNMGKPAAVVDFGDLPSVAKSEIMIKAAQEAMKFGRSLSAYAWARASTETHENQVARRMIEALEAEDLRRDALRKGISDRAKGMQGKRQ